MAKKKVTPEAVAEAPAPVVENKVVSVVTDVVIKSKFNLELLKLKHQQVVQGAENITFHKDTINVDVPKLVALRSLVKKIDDARTLIKQPYFDACKLVDSIAKDIVSPLNAILAAKEVDYRKVAQEIENDRLIAERENARIQNINNAIDNLILNQSTAIANATSVPQLEVIENTLNINKKNAALYQEFLPNVVKRVNELLPLLKQQKKSIEDLEALQKEKNKAEKKGDDAKLLKLMTKEENLESKIEESKIVVQETAINQATQVSAAPVYMSQPAVKARRTTWKFELVNVDEALKSHRDALDITLNSRKASEIFEANKEVCTLGGKKEFTLGGIRFYEHKDY